MRSCTHCVLTEAFPGVRFDSHGVCSCCRESKIEGDVAAKQDRARRKFEQLAGSIRGARGYHCLLAYSGGKDSTYTLWQLRERYGLRVLAVTFDNGFVSPHAFTNIRRVVEVVNADHLFVKPRFDLLRKVFASVSENSPFPMKALERASSICNACMGLVKSVTLRIAIEQRIPVVVYGWSPGQAPVSASMFRMNAGMLEQMHETRMAPLRSIAGDDLDPYLLNESHFSRPEDLPYSVNPLAFLPYEEDRIVDQVKQLGWQPPTDTDGNSTNCLLNAYANRVHLRKYGFHPYAFEIAGLVRRGAMTREQGLAKLADLGSEEVAKSVAQRLQVEGVL